jgi:hypothetical protein
MEIKLRDISYVFDSLLLSDIHWERVKQISQWGGSEHDDTHFANDWARYIDHQLELGYGEDNNEDGSHNWSERFIKIAALAIAALESLERKNG